MKRTSLLATPVLIAVAILATILVRARPGSKGETPSIPLSSGPTSGESIPQEESRWAQPRSDANSDSEGESTLEEASSPETFERRMKGLLAENTKDAYRRALLRWRDASRLRNHDILLGNLISKAPSKKMALAAGELLLYECSELTLGQISGYCGLVARGADSTGIRVLCITSANQPRARKFSLRHLSWIAHPKAIPELERLLVRCGDPEIREALQQALQNSRR